MKAIKFPMDDIPSLGHPYISDKVNPVALKRLFEKAKEREVDLHAFEIYRDNELMLRLSLPPYDCLDKTHYFSLSKAFTSTAIGFACDEGLLSVETKIVDIFPDLLPETVSENLAKCTIHNVLSMNSGKNSESLMAMMGAESAAKAFLAGNFERIPGTFFHYDTGATCFLAAVVKKLTGMNVLDYLNLKFFRFANIHDVYWYTTADGTQQGGVGLHASCDDAAKLGLLYLNKGMWNGKQLLSEDWVSKAGQPYSDNRSFNNWIDWQSGYGYQFWVCSRGGYRGDGANGQYSLIMPAKNMVVAGLNESENLQNVVDVLTELSDELFIETEEKLTAAEAAALAEDFYAVPASPVPEIDGEKFYVFEKNIFELNYLRLYTESGNYVMQLSNGRELFDIHCGNGQWLRNRNTISSMISTRFASGICEKTEGIAAAYENRGDELIVHVRSLSQPQYNTFKSKLEGSYITIELGGRTFNNPMFADKKILRAKEV